MVRGGDRRHLHGVDGRIGMARPVCEIGKKGIAGPGRNVREIDAGRYNSDPHPAAEIIYAEKGRA